MPIHQRIAIIGAGHVGATAAYALMLRGLFNEIVLIDQNEALAQAEAADLADANALARPAHIWAGSYADAAQAQIAVITAGAATHGDQTRLSVSNDSAAIVASCVDALAAAGFNGILIVAANPVDLMSLLAFQRAGLPAAAVIGTGTLLDSNRLRQHLAAQFDVAAGAIDGFVLGEHGDSSVTAVSTIRIGGLTPDQFTAAKPGDHAAADQAAADQAATDQAADWSADVRDAAYRIVSGKGHTSYGIATAIVRICEAIVRDERAVLPVSTLLTGQYGLSGLYISVPCIIGARGVERALVLDLGAQERSGLQASAKILRDGYQAMQQPAPAGGEAAPHEHPGMLVGPNLGQFETE